MRWKLGICMLATVATLVAVAEVAADPGHERPRITTLRWKDPPVRVGPEVCIPEDCEFETLIVKAHDPDSSITEVQVWFSENDDAGPFTYAHTYCVQGKRAGEPARLEIPGSYSRPGTYTVAVVAYSHRRCLPHERGDEHPARHSRVKRLETVVRPATS